MYDQTTKIILPHCDTCSCASFGMDRRFIDKFGDEWVRRDLRTVRRLSDGCIGGWFKGKGLTALTEAEK